MAENEGLPEVQEGPDSRGLWDADDGACGICGHDVDPARFDVDHVIPLSRGGPHVLANLQAAHPTCNRRKYNSLPGDF